MTTTDAGPKSHSLLETWYLSAGLLTRDSHLMPPSRNRSSGLMSIRLPLTVARTVTGLHRIPYTLMGSLCVTLDEDTTVFY
jgi:hypothetical protein